MQPVLYSCMSKTWQRIGTKISYYRNNYHKINNSSKEKEEDDATERGGGGGGGGGVRPKSVGGSQISKRYFTATFTVSFPNSKDLYYIAYHYPYTYSMLKVNRIVTH